MKAEPLLEEIEKIKDRFDEQAGGNLSQFFNQMNAWLKDHPHAGPVVHSPEELKTRVRQRESMETPLPRMETYRVYNPIIAELHRTREKIYRERKKHSEPGEVNFLDERANDSYALREEPPKKNKNN